MVKFYLVLFPMMHLKIEGHIQRNSFLESDVVNLSLVVGSTFDSFSL